MAHLIARSVLRSVSLSSKPHGCFSRIGSKTVIGVRLRSKKCRQKGEAATHHFEKLPFWQLMLPSCA